MAQSLMSLETAQVTYLEIKIRTDDIGLPMSKNQNTGDSKETESQDIQVEFKVMEHINGDKYLIPLTINVTPPENSMYQKILIKLFGIFSFPEGTDDIIKNDYVPITCLANLYGMARGIIMQSTGAFPGNQYILPLVNVKTLIGKNSDRDNSPKKKKVTSGKVINSKKNNQST